MTTKHVIDDEDYKGFKTTLEHFQKSCIYRYSCDGVRKFKVMGSKFVKLFVLDVVKNYSEQVRPGEDVTVNKSTVAMILDNAELVHGLDLVCSIQEFPGEWLVYMIVDPELTPYFIQVAGGFCSFSSARRLYHLEALVNGATMTAFTRVKMRTCQVDKNIDFCFIGDAEFTKISEKDVMQGRVSHLLSHCIACFTARIDEVLDKNYFQGIEPMVLTASLAKMSVDSEHGQKIWKAHREELRESQVYGFSKEVFHKRKS